jgi:uncharacterized damage-inducible protein DinB
MVGRPWESCRASVAYRRGMADLKPPHRIAGERETLLVLWQFQRESLVRKCEGVDPSAADSSPVGSGTTLLWLVQHTAFAERLWLLQRFLGLDAAAADEGIGATDTLDGALAAYRATWARVDAVVAAADLDDVCALTGVESPVNLRWVLMHLLEETARHAGHADILRELIDGATGR